MIKLVGIIIVGVAIVVGAASRFLFKKTDNVVEEIAEQIIKSKTGHDVDLSPDTPEKDKDAKNKLNRK